MGPWKLMELFRRSSNDNRNNCWETVDCSERKFLAAIHATGRTDSGHRRCRRRFGRNRPESLAMDYQ